MLYPATCEELGSHDKSTLCCEVWAPLPVSVSEAGEFEASLKNEMLPVELPEDAGVNVTPNDTLLPAATVVGNVMPLTE